VSKTLPIAALKASPTNPRTIDNDALAGLRASMKTFGDLSGIVWNERTGHLVAGHQRMRALTEAGAKDWTRAEDGTGVVVHPVTGERFPVRVVSWDETTETLANLAANNPEIQGEFTADAEEQLHALEKDALFDDLHLDQLLAELDDGEDDAGDGREERTGLEEFMATPPNKPVWILIAANEDVAAEVEADLINKYGSDKSIRIEKSSSMV
jgi:hypothetical protein